MYRRKDTKLMTTDRGGGRRRKNCKLNAKSFGGRVADGENG